MRQHLDEQSDEEIAAPPRPHAEPTSFDRFREWIEWFGVTRLVTSGVAVMVVCAGAWFLVRTPPPPSEASLPMAVATSDPASPSSALLEPAAEPTTPSGPVVVHVAGAVAAPGVYELAPASRVDDAIRRAGGTTSTADPGQLNLASPLADGDRIYVPEVDEVVVAPLDPSGTSSQPGPAAPVDLNRAGHDELERLPGIGPATAAAIVTDRDLNGPFASVDDLERVAGIGPAKLAALAGLVTT